MKDNKSFIFADYPELCTVKEMCEMLRIGKTKAHELLEKKEIPHRKSSGKILIPKNAIIRYYLRQPKWGNFTPPPPLSSLPVYNLLFQVNGVDSGFDDDDEDDYDEDDDEDYDEDYDEDEDDDGEEDDE